MSPSRSRTGGSARRQRARLSRFPASSSGGAGALLPAERPPWGTGALLGALAGVLVGGVDGLRAALTMDMDLPSALSAAVLAAAVDGLVGWVLGLVAEVLVRGTNWGWRARVPRWAQAVSYLPWAALSSTASIASVGETALRHERFLSAGIVVLVMIAMSAAGAALTPLVARFVAGKHIDSSPSRRPSAYLSQAAWLAVPFATVVVGLVVFAAVSRASAPLTGRSFHVVAALVGTEAAVLPWLLSAALVLPYAIASRWARALGAGVVVGGAAVGVAVTWEAHLRFVPWQHVGVLGAMLLVGTILAILDRRRFRRRHLRGALPGNSAWLMARGAVTSLAPILLAMVALTATHREAARKAVDAHAGIAGKALVSAWAALDFDGDGYPRWIGGGDCDDSDPRINPGALDYPDDQIDQDCNGTDASTALLASPHLGPLPGSIPKDLNILFVTIDTLRADHLGCYGYTRPTSPRIDELAAAGTLFTNGWAHAPSTRYSMPAMATGRWPSAIAWDESIWWPRIAPSMPTLGELMKAQGLLTAAFYSFSYFSRADRRGFERGIDVYRDDRAALHLAVNGPMESHGSSSREMADDTLAFLSAHKNERFFLWTHFYDPHLSYEPHVEVPSFGSERVDLYDGEIRFTDMHLGRVIDRLKALGLWERTAIVLTGDHGEGFGEHGVTEHGFDLYGPQTKVPVIVRVPGLAPGESSAPVGHIDLTATMAHLAGASADSPQVKSLLGRSVLPQIAGAKGEQEGESEPVFQEVTSERGKKRALVDERFHLIWNWMPSNTTECFDREIDPLELHDLWQGNSSPSRCRALKTKLENLVSVLSLPPGFSEKLAHGLLSHDEPDPSPRLKIDARFGDQIGVLGVDVDHPVLHAGDTAGITVFFKVLKPVAAGYSLFFHALGPGGLFRNLDHVPLDGALPVNRWEKGMRLRDTVSLALPVGTPPGTYEIVIGFFKGLDRLPVFPAAASNGDNALRLVQVVVK